MRTIIFGPEAAGEGDRFGRLLTSLGCSLMDPFWTAVID
jgi:hypothetical protein